MGEMESSEDEARVDGSMPRFWMSELIDDWSMSMSASISVASR